MKRASLKRAVNGLKSTLTLRCMACGGGRISRLWNLRYCVLRIMRGTQFIQYVQSVYIPEPESVSQTYRNNTNMKYPPNPLLQVFTANGWPAVSTPVLRKLAGKPGAAKRALDALMAEDGLEGGARGAPDAAAGVVNQSISTAGVC